ncbi:PREDICTED: leucine-rich repeat transmembrane protein FLRT1-like [Habropoda laboriosa]|nr:PREDICTED: leucine-rich repeat transmembrane protein FLRT1-like [Habropoda laboriosa]
MAGRSEAHKTSNTSVEHANLSHFCKIERCNAVICSNILEKQDPGAIASSYIENTFKVSCTAARSVKLSFNDCVFPANKLRRNWLSSNVSIEELAFEKCFLSEIEEDAFSSTIYKETKKIVMVKNKLNSLRRSTFASLETLNELVIRENIIKEAQLNLLEDVASTLSSLEFSRAIEDREVLRNITGGSKLPNLQILSIRGNSISTIDDKLFSGVPAVTSLYLDSSKIETVSEHTLEPMASSLSQIILTDNSISTLPAGLLDPVISRQNFLMMIQRNPWHCVCDLKWMQDLLLSRPNIFSEIPTCETPRENARKSFTVAEFCHRSNRTTTVSSTIDTTEPNLTQINQTTTQTSNAANINVTCSVAYTNMRTFGSRKLSSKNILQVPSRFPSFRVSKTSLERSVLVNLPDLNQGVTLLWFDNDDVERTLCCAKNVKHSYLVRDIDPKAAYTICLLDDNTPVSPLNCLAVVADPENYSKTWLTNGDKSLVVSLSILSLVLLFLFGGFLSFLLIRKYPSLLRGSKRVMLVKRRNVDAIVLPKGVDISEKEERCGEEASFSNSKLHEDEYVMPLPPERISLARRSRMFRMSSQSDWHSYVSDVEPTETQLDSWRLMRLKSELEKQKSDAPPLPPHPSDMIPSLSVTVESKDELYHTTIV